MASAAVGGEHATREVDDGPMRLVEPSTLEAASNTTETVRRESMVKQS
jgi:hypothetical protein